MDMPESIAYLIREMKNKSVPEALRENYCHRLEQIQEAIKKETDNFNNSKKAFRRG